MTHAGCRRWSEFEPFRRPELNRQSAFVEELGGQVDAATPIAELEGLACIGSSATDRDKRSTG